METRWEHDLECRQRGDLDVFFPKDNLSSCEEFTDRFPLSPRSHGQSNLYFLLVIPAYLPSPAPLKPPGL